MNLDFYLFRLNQSKLNIGRRFVAKIAKISDASVTSGSIVSYHSQGFLCCAFPATVCISLSCTQTYAKLTEK